jgi:hypothetical protein
MIARFLIAAALAASLTATTAAAQSAADLLQKGIYTQETAGDADGAIQIFRQIIGSAGVARAMTAQAQSQIVAALLQKGDLAGASQEFGKLAREYADQKALVSDMGQRLRTIAENGPALLLGSFQNGVYRHNWTGVEFAVPSDWSFRTQKAQPDGGDRVDLDDSTSKTVSAFVWIRRQDTPQAKIADRLQQRLDYKVSVQRRPPDGYLAYHLRPESVMRTLVGGRQALTAIGDYVDARGARMSESLTFIDSEKSTVFFSMIAAAAEFGAVQSRFESIVRTAQIP